MTFVKIGAVSSHTFSNGVNKFLPVNFRFLADMGKIWDPYMTLFSSIEYHGNPHSERHGQNVVYVRELRKIRIWEGYTFLTGVNFSMCRENVWYLKSRERLGEILVHQGAHSLQRCSYRQLYMIQLCINIYVLRYSN
jgi:hypothetical protein